jgi:hypothetical protein
VVTRALACIFVNLSFSVLKTHAVRLPIVVTAEFLSICCTTRIFCPGSLRSISGKEIHQLVNQTSLLFDQFTLTFSRYEEWYCLYFVTFSSVPFIDD